jgi:Fic family protein
MRPSYSLTTGILKLVSEVSHKIGEVNASFLTKQSPELRKRNRIRTIQASLAIEGNTLSIDQVTAIIENKRVLGPAKDIKEVSNAFEAYNQINKFSPFSEKSFLAAHGILMEGLIKNAGKYRNTGVGIIKGSEIAHMAPPAGNVPFLVKDLFNYLKKQTNCFLLKAVYFITKRNLFIHLLMAMEEWEGFGRQYC